jgi:oligopeptide/dipeptide ABC transporter ATP-binding protein
MKAAKPILAVEGLNRIFTRSAGLLKRDQRMHAVHDLTLALQEGETLGIVGESTLARMLVGLDRPSSGVIRLDGKPIEGGSRELARQIQYVFQDPVASLNPRKTIGQILEAPLLHLGDMDKTARRQRIDTLLDAVGLNREQLQRYPHEFSGGQAQRIGIARALAPQPRILVLDEPVSALDVSIQAQILQLLKALKQEFALSYLFISHDLSVVESISDRVGVMYFGKLVELAGARTLFSRPAHPYTELLISSAPSIRKSADEGDPDATPQELPDPYAPPPGCSFAARCPSASERCRQQAPPLAPCEHEAGHSCACWHPAGCRSG